MAELDTRVDVFVRDCVYFQHPKLGLSKGVIVKFFFKWYVYLPLHQNYDLLFLLLGFLQGGVL